MVKRAEVRSEDKWAIEEMYASTDKLMKDYQYLVDHIQDLSKYKGKVLESSSNLLETLETDNQLSRLLDKVVIYAMLNFDTDSTNGESVQLKNKMIDLQTKLSVESSYLRPELLRGSWETIESYMEELPQLKKYKRSLSLVYRIKDHTLSEKEEKIISKLSNILNTGKDSSYALRNSDLTFGKVMDEKGKEIELTNTNYAKLIKSRDRELRKTVFKQLHNRYYEMRNTLASLYNSEVEKHVKLAELYHFDSARDMALFKNEIDIKIYDQLLEGIHETLPILYDYYKLKKEVLGLSELHLYDVYIDLIKLKEEKKYTFDEAKELVIDALGALGSEYQELVKKAFEEGWIDKYPNTGKRPGAYSWGCYDSKPYILTNFEGTYHDVSTLAHEIGHSIHSYLSIQNNSYQDYAYKIFVAEVASTTNELLFNDYMLKHSADKNEKLMILNQQMELFKATIYRQAMFAEAEKLFYEKVENGDSLTADTLESIYYDLVKLYFGSDVIIDEEIKSEWSKIPHFYMNFYVYQYATGLSAASKIATAILENKDNAKENYLKFLTLGGTLPAIEELKIAGVDMTKKETIMDALDYFQSLIKQFRILYNERN